MSPRAAVLGTATAAVFAVGVYLFVQVHAAPAPAPAEPRRDAPPTRVTPPPTPPPAPTEQAMPAISGPVRAVDRPGLTVSRQVVAPTAATPPPAPLDPPTALPNAAVDLGAVRANPKLDALMGEANKAYDRGDVDEARDIAKKIVAEQPANVRMLRILVSTSCMDGDAATARQYYATLPKSDQGQMRSRCERYGVTFDNPTP